MDRGESRADGLALQGGAEGSGRRNPPTLALRILVRAGGTLGRDGVAVPRWGQGQQDGRGGSQCAREQPDRRRAASPRLDRAQPAGLGGTAQAARLACAAASEEGVLPGLGGGHRRSGRHAGGQGEGRVAKGVDGSDRFHAHRVIAGVIDLDYRRVATRARAKVHAGGRESFLRFARVDSGIAACSYVFGENRVSRASRCSPTGMI
mmetsp:Transcript_1676/g.4968  ORF Transcript_1676/g.4968 Transcript_1676/m.4968 type:complete len:206 (-) Transcript_1676:232-849(-)